MNLGIEYLHTINRNSMGSFGNSVNLENELGSWGSASEVLCRTGIDLIILVELPVIFSEQGMPWWIPVKEGGIVRSRDAVSGGLLDLGENILIIQGIVEPWDGVLERVLFRGSLEYSVNKSRIEDKLSAKLTSTSLGSNRQFGADALLVACQPFLKHSADYSTVDL